MLSWGAVEEAADMAHTEQERQAIAKAQQEADRTGRAARTGVAGVPFVLPSCGDIGACGCGKTHSGVGICSRCGGTFGGRRA